MSDLDLRLRRPLAEEQPLFAGCRHRRCLLNCLEADFLLWSNAQAAGILRPGPESLPLTAVLPGGRVCGVVEFQDWDRINLNARLTCDVLVADNRGLAGSLLAAAMDYGMADRGLKRLFGYQLETEGWALEAAEASGFATEGALAEACFTRGRHAGLSVLGRVAGEEPRRRQDPPLLKGGGKAPAAAAPGGAEAGAAGGDGGGWRPYQPGDFVTVLRWFLEDDFYLRAQHPTSVPEDRVRRLVEGHPGRTWVWAPGGGPEGLEGAGDTAGRSIEGIGILLVTDELGRVARLEARFPRSVDEGRAAWRLEALACLCFRTLNLHKVFAPVHGFDRRGQGWYAGAGFRLEAVLRGHVYKDARYFDAGVYGRAAARPPAGGGEG